MDADDLESAINSAKMETVPKVKEEPEISKLSREQEIGFHKGAISTLVSERNELIKMVGNVEAIMQMHVGRLKELEGNNGREE